MKKPGFRLIRGLCMKVLFMAVIVICLVSILGSNVYALTAQVFITVKINGSIINMDTQPYMKNYRTMVPVRALAEALNAEVEWFGDERRVVIKDGDRTVELFIDSEKYYINGVEYFMDVAPEILNGRTMIPVRTVATALDCSVEWDCLTYTVLLGKEGAAVPAAYVFNRNYTDEDILWLARIVAVEGRGLSLDAKVAIANVVLNRVKASIYPDTVYGVIFDTNYAVQFPPAHKPGFRESVPDNYSVIAAKMALEGINNIENCLYFNYKPFTWKSKDELYRIIDGEYFYY